MIRTPLFAVPLLVLVAVADPVRARADEPTTNPEASNEFVVQLRSDTTAETVISQIAEAGREQLAAACVANPSASVRVFNPLASGDYADVACSTILDGGESVGLTSGALTSGGERLGQSQQKWSLVGAACSLITIGSGLIASRLLCPQAPDPDARRSCGYVSDGGFSTLGFLCFLI